jgi:ribonucleoside-diphosphate reductase alpha chain
VSKINASLVSEELLSAAASSWDEAVELGELYGIRNSHVSLLAPTGTTALIMDCETTGIEPDLSLVKSKRLVGGESISLVSHTVTKGLQALGYGHPQINDIVQYIDDNKTIVGAPHLKKEHEYTFACSVGDNIIGYQGHLNMMAAVQPFLSGAISKTVNTPEMVTVEDIEQIHIDAWKKGLKSVSVYRDNCRVPRVVSKPKQEVDYEEDTTTSDASDKYILKGAVRTPLPRVRNSKTYKFQIADLEGYFTVGEYEAGNPGELFVNVSKQGSTLSGLTDSFAMSMSQGLQYGVPLKRFVRSLRGTSFAPSGMTDDPEIRTASSITDYIVRRLALDYLSFDDKLELGIVSIDDIPSDQLTLIDDESGSSEEKIKEDKEVSTEFTPNAKVKLEISDSTAPLCYNCGNQTQRAGTCFVCTSCGSTTGCS